LFTDDKSEIECPEQHGGEDERREQIAIESRMTNIVW